LIGSPLFEKQTTPSGRGFRGEGVHLLSVNEHECSSRTTPFRYRRKPEWKIHAGLCNKSERSVPL